MKIKKLQITGFKSFVDKTSISFPQGISAVVGPNGCGKSNIIDALRWVMGEQSMKQLRGKSREDIIFAGTHGHPPLNMTEVSLTLLNDNGSAPEELRDYAEIQLTRRLYRSGESAYFLNKQACRLKDIHNVFMGSGMGAKSYAVIQQGNIGAITDAGPEERRFFIEEAAGVTRYKTRKTEALRKVQATNQNLLRLSDIIAEVKRQTAGLKRQAKKAETYQKNQDRIRQLDIQLACRYHRQFTQKIDSTDTLLQSLQNSDTAHATQIQKLDAAVEAIKLQRSQKNQTISSQRADRHETQRTIDRSENDLEHLRRDIERFDAEIAELISAHADLDRKNRNIIAEIAQEEAQNIGLNAKIKQLQTAIAKEQADSRDITDHLADLNRHLETHKKHLMESVALEARHRSISQNAATNRENLQRRLKRIAEEEAVATKKVTALHNRQASAQEALAALESELESVASSIKALQGRLAEESGALGRRVKQVQTLELEYNKIRSRYLALKKMEANFDWYGDGVKAVLTKARSDAAGGRGGAAEPAAYSGQGVLGIMADILEPAPAYETAVEACLGEALQYILVEDQPSGIEAIDYLTATQSGRSGFVPLSRIKPLSSDPKKHPAPDRLLLNHITVKPPFEPVVQSMLGHVVVAADLSEALALWNRNGVAQAIVTQNGEVISSQGILLGGSRDKKAGLLAKKQEIRRLENRLTEMDRQLAAARQAQKDLEATVRALERELQQLIENKTVVTRDKTEAEKAVYRATEDVKHARNHLEVVALEQEQLLGEESDIENEIASHNQALARIEADVKAAQDQVTAVTGEIHRFSLKMEDFNKTIVDLKLRLTALTAQLDNSTKTLRRLQEFRDDGLKRIEQLAADIVRKKEKKILSVQKTEALDRSLGRMYESFETLTRELESNETDYRAIDAQISENDRRISEIQTLREETLQKIRLLEVELSQQRLKREALENRIEERYHRNLCRLAAAPENGRSDKGEPAETAIEDLESQLDRLSRNLTRLGDVNVGAIKEYDALKERYDFLTEQRDDLVKALDDLHQVIRKINKITQDRFMKTFTAVNEKLAEVFPRLFEGGSARLVLTQADNPLETGVEFMVHPAGKKLTRMSLLSGGEKALAAIAFVFSIFLIKPASFCLLDEIDAPLDEANVFRFNNLLKVIGGKSQIIMITHNKRSMEFADVLFGITMAQKGVSRVVSVHLDQTETVN